MSAALSVTDYELGHTDTGPVDETAGRVIGLFIAPAAGEPMTSVDAVEALRDKGLAGDRYFNHEGRFSRRRVPGREVTDVTLVEREVIDLLRRRGIALDAAATRRNIVTTGVALNELIGNRFQVGDVLLLGVNVCEPCAELFAPDNRREALRGLAHKGGLRARILSNGDIRIGDAVIGPGQPYAGDLEQRPHAIPG